MKMQWQVNRARLVKKHGIWVPAESSGQNRQKCDTFDGCWGVRAMARILISHRTADSLEAEHLASDLRAAGHDVWLDIWKIGLGDSIVERINTGLADAEYVVLCLSSVGVDAPWISREWMSALARQLEHKGVKLLPVRLTGGDLPPILADIQYADAVKDYASALRAILNAVRRAS
ncbi:toll/interleukin-1 receptor domain-containing protein [Bradyrhizobium sp. CCBAU 65884]|uniref:toll/interleukin-1 receptor domain-containing protein n=1 Tax=Bradyrhizobium sp. CCBAU 65884 TaxID=722477 RepID=UPI003FA42760